MASSEDRISLVVNGFVSLTTDERTKCIERMNSFINGNTDLRKSITENASTRISKISLGPIAGGCLCCGKG